MLYFWSQRGVDFVLEELFAVPVTSLRPVTAAGWFAGLVEAYAMRPNMEDFENVPEDVHMLKGFWRNKVARILMVVVFTNLGGSVGTIIGGVDVIRVFFNNLWG